MSESGTEQDAFLQVMQQHSQWLSSGGEQGKRAVLREMDFTGVDVAAMGVTFAKVDCTEANFTGANVKGIDFSGAILNLANFSGARLEGANFSEAHFVSANFTGAKCKGVVFHQAVLRNVVAHEADFSEAQLQHADMREADFSRCVFDKADLTGAQCRAAVFSGVLLQHVDVSVAQDISLQYVAESLAMEREALEKARVAFEKQQSETAEAGKLREAGLNQREEKLGAERKSVEGKQALEEQVARRLFEYSGICKYLAMSWFIIAATLGTLMAYLYMQERLPMSGFEVALTAVGALLVFGMHLFAAISAFKEHQAMMRTLNARVDEF